MESNSVCNHTSDNKIGRLRSGSPIWMLLTAGTGNGERGTGNGKRETGNGKRETGNGERGTGNRERESGN